MTKTQRLLGLTAMVLVAFIAAVFATDAVVTDEPEDMPEAAAPLEERGAPPVTIGPVTNTEVAAPVRLTTPYWIDIASSATDPAPPPPTANEPMDPGGVVVVRPPSGDPVGHPPDEQPPDEQPPTDLDGSIDPDIEAIAEAQDVPPGTPAALAVPPIQPLRRFADLCAVFAGGACPVGLPAIVVIAPHRQLDISANASPGTVGAMELGARACPEDFVEGEFYLWITTTVPSSIGFTYVKSMPRGDVFTAIRTPALGPGDPEYDRWIENQSNGEFSETAIWSWFRTCVVLDLDPNAFYEIFDITARAFDGQVALYERPVSISTVVPGESMAPPPSFVYSNSSRLSLHVWKKTAEEGYRAFVWPIDLSEPDPASCADIETDLFVGGSIGTTHPDFRIAATSHPEQAATPHEIYDDAYTATQKFDMDLREGRRYSLCIWEARLGTASFDVWEILGRSEFEVSTPNSHPIVATLVRAGIRDDTQSYDVHVYAENHDYCDSRGPVLNATVEQVGEGTRIAREVFCETWGLPPDGSMFTRISVDNVVADVLAIPLDPFTNCGVGTSDPGCAIRVSEYVAHTVDIPGSCNTNCSWVDLRFRIDYLASNGEGSDYLSVGPAGTFSGMAPEPVGTPDVDTNSMTLEPVPNRYDVLTATFDLVSPSEYTITVIAPVRMREGDDSCNAETSGNGEGRVEVPLTGLCADTMYQFGSIVLSDLSGNTTQRDLGGVVRQVWTNGYASFLWLEVVMLSLDDEAQAIAECSDTDTVGGFTRGAAEDCWNHFKVRTSSPVSLAGEKALLATIPACVSPLGAARERFGAPPAVGVPPESQAVVHGGLIDFEYTIYIDVSPDCDSGGSSDGPFARFAYSGQIGVGDLDREFPFTFREGGTTWRVTMGWTDVGIANRQS